MGMRSGWKWLFATALAVVVWQSSKFAKSQDPSVRREDAAARVDLLGDTLPVGATLRLGTARLRSTRCATVAFSPDGQLVASAGGEPWIRIWDSATGKPRQHVACNFEEETRAVAFSPDGEKLASVSNRGLVRLWNVRIGELDWSEVGHSQQSSGAAIDGVAFAPDGLTLATAGEDGKVCLWDSATGERLLQLANGNAESGPYPVAFSPDGALLASSSEGGPVRIWNLNDGRELQSIESDYRELLSLAFTRDGKYLFTGGCRYERLDRAIRIWSEIDLWEVATGQKQAGLETDEELLGDCTIAISPDGRWLVSGHHEKLIVWDVASRSPLRVIRGKSGTFYGNRTQNLSISSRQGLLAATSGDEMDYKIYLWNLETGDELFPQPASHTESVFSACSSPDGDLIATGSADGLVHLWNGATGEHVRLLDRGTAWVRYVEFLPGGELLALGRETHERDESGNWQYRGEAKICRVADGSVVHHFRVPDRVMCGDLSFDGARMAVGIGLGYLLPETDVADCKLLVWDVASGEKLAEMKGSKSPFQELRFSTDGERLTSLDHDRTHRTWSIGERREIASHQIQGGASHKMLTIPDSSRVASLGSEKLAPRVRRGKISVQEQDSDTPIWQTTYSDVRPREGAVSADGKMLAACLVPLSRTQGRQRIVVLSTKDGKETRSFDIGDGLVQSLAFTPDGRLLSGMQAGDTLVWDLTIDVAPTPPADRSP